MDDEALARDAAGLVREGWDLPVTGAAPLGGGMNSATAVVDLPDRRAVLKWVRGGAAAGLVAGCDAARRLARHGLLTGEPFLTATGELVHRTEDGAVALLQLVPGDGLGPDDPRDRHDLGLTLAAVHAAEPTRGSGVFMGDLMAEMARDVEPWVRPSVDLVLAEHRDLPELTWAVLHADPAPEAFLRQPDGRVALIDWGATTYGPVLYDVASALMYLGGRREADPFWDAYVAYSPAPVAELTEHLAAFTRYRAAVQAAYFSMRIGSGDRTGIEHDGENWKGLRDAEQMLRASGARVVSG